MEKSLETLGIVFVSESVSEKRGEGPKVLIGSGPIPVVKDLDKFMEVFGREAVLGSLDGSSIRVKAQAVLRACLNKRMKPEAIEAAQINMLRGIRASAATVVEVVKYVLPDGSSTTDKAAALEAWQNA